MTELVCNTVKALLLKQIEEVCPVLAVYLGIMTWPGSRFKTKNKKDFFTHHIIASLNSVTQNDVKHRNSNHFKRGLDQFMKHHLRLLNMMICLQLLTEKIPQPQRVKLEKHAR